MLISKAWKNTRMFSPGIVREKKELACLSRKILGINFVRSPCNKLLGLLHHPWIQQELWVKNSQEAPNLLLSWHFPVPFEGLVFCCPGHISGLSRQYVLPDTQLCQRDKRKKKIEEMEEGGQDYDFSNHRICGLLYGSSRNCPFTTEEWRRKIQSMHFDAREGGEDDHYFTPCIFHWQEY